MRIVFLVLAIIAVSPLRVQPQGVPFTELVPVPAGPFTMGSASGPADERPSHNVDLSAFSIERTPVTNRQFAEFLKAKGPGAKNEFYDPDDGDARIHLMGGQWTADPGAEQLPVVEPTWYGAREYCRWAGRRLPTEAEWEKAARGTDGRRFPWGNAQPDQTRAHYSAGWRESSPSAHVRPAPARMVCSTWRGTRGNGPSAYKPIPTMPVTVERTPTARSNYQRAAEDRIQAAKRSRPRIEAEACHANQTRATTTSVFAARVSRGEIAATAGSSVVRGESRPRKTESLGSREARRRTQMSRQFDAEVSASWAGACEIQAPEAHRCEGGKEAYRSTQAYGFSRMGFS